ncbi:MAG TPA: sugar ABC transporter ATP-binding protein [Pirellulales bacterium]|jgi:ribose transport system ATP-binding protein|nr:sugar ABC transporter ATP-binding protein [Pirellulales bacterium]
MPIPLLELSSISKRFPGVVALDSVSLEFFPREVVALIGENGAGKSTLMRILGGVHQADAGTIRLEGKPVTIRSVHQAIEFGIGFIHQELNVLDNLDVAANVFLGRERLWGGPLCLVDRSTMRNQAAIHLKRLGLNIDPATPLSELSLAQQQMVEIAKVLSQNARIIIMDEPTSCLTLTETGRLLATIKDLRDQGVSIIYISHRLNEVKQCADRVVALRDGKNAGFLDREQINHQNMVRLMVGRDLKDLFVRTSGERQGRCLQVRGLRTAANPHATVSFDVERGEVLGIAGLVGAGRSEVAQAVFGVDPPLEGSISIDGKPVAIHSSRDAISAGIFLVPEDRRKMGLVTDMSIRENVSMPGIWNYTKLALISRNRESRAAAEQIKRLRIKAPTVETRVANLSGGNQQKVVLGKWLALKPRVLIFDEPTRGIDVGAKAEIYKLMSDLAANGVAIIMISSDMEEVLGVADRIAVMHEGAITGIVNRNEATEEGIMNLAVGMAERRAIA